MFFRTYQPGPPLSRFVQAFWIYQVGPQPAPGMRGLPTGTAQLIIDLSGDGLPMLSCATTGGSSTLARALFNGADTRFILDEGGYVVNQIGVDFKPGGAYPFFGPPASEFRDAHLPLETLWGIRGVDEPRECLMRAQTLQERLAVLEAVLLGHLAHPLTRHPAVTLALRAFSTAPRGQVIAQVADQLALSHGHFIRVFRDEVGLSPKQYYRIRRFNRALRRIHREDRPDWTQLALESGYYDQAHLTHEFQRFAGVSPGIYLRDCSATMPTWLTLPSV
jgi:AraC-like DNA-binding protein